MPKKIDGKYYYVDEKIDLKTGELFAKTRIVDDTNMKEETLGLRRAKLLDIYHYKDVYPLPKAIFFPADLVKVSKSGNNLFIDYSGKLFRYIKSTSALLVCHKIEKVIPVRNGALLELQGSAQRYKSIVQPLEGKYAGILHFNHCTLLYGIYDSAFSTTRRKV